jgi:uncharacterized protein YyaL (SSP411 family)
MIGAFADGARILGEPRYLDAATRAAEFVLGTLQSPDGGLRRVYRAGQVRLDAYLEDYAYLADGLVSLYEAGADERYLRAARTLLERIRTAFRAPDGGFYSTAEQHEALVLRPREGFDGATPSANAVAARALTRLSYHFGEPDLRAEARRALEAYGQLIARQPRAFATSLMGLEMMETGPVELAFIGAPDDPRRHALERAAASVFLPYFVAGHHDPGGRASTLPLFAGKTAVHGDPALYVCRDYACRRPVTHVDAVAAALAAPP